VRHLVEQASHRAGLADEALRDFVLAVQELMTNAVRHGGGWGRLCLRRDGDLLICAVTDCGPGFAGDPARHGRLPAPDAHGGRGLFLAQQMTDNLHVSSGRTGVTVTVTMNLIGRNLPDIS
jgi:serine/threonine-protein kinase RsbW